MEYTVERVEGMRLRKGCKEYYLKWKGFPRTLNSWEPLDKLNCMELIASFEESQKNKGVEKRLLMSPKAKDSFEKSLKNKDMEKRLFKSPKAKDSFEKSVKNKDMEKRLFMSPMAKDSFEKSLKNKGVEKHSLKSPKPKVKPTENKISKEDEEGNGPKEEEIKPAILEPLKILGSTDASGELMLLIQWKNSDRADLVKAKAVNIKWPQLVIKYYEDHVCWHEG